jgi:hypothetical protein
MVAAPRASTLIKRNANATERQLDVLIVPTSFFRPNDSVFVFIVSPLRLICQDRDVLEINRLRGARKREEGSRREVEKFL